MLLVMLALIAAEPSADEILKLLQSTKSKDRAWGAHYAAEQKLAQAEGALLATMNDSNVRPYALDALHQINARLSPEQIATLYKNGEIGDALLFWLSDEDAPDSAFVQILGEAWNEGFVASANVLARRRSERFARWLVEHAQLQLELSVSDPGSPLGGVQGSSVGGICGTPLVRVKEGYPKALFHELTSEKKDASLISPGTYPIYVRRVASGCHCKESIDRGERIYSYLVELTKVPPPNAYIVRKTIVFHSPAQLENDYAQWKADLTQAFARWTQPLHAGGAPRFALRVYDQREIQSAPLPKLAEESTRF